MGVYTDVLMCVCLFVFFGGGAVGGRVGVTFLLVFICAHDAYSQRAPTGDDNGAVVGDAQEEILLQRVVVLVDVFIAISCVLRMGSVRLLLFCSAVRWIPCVCMGVVVNQPAARRCRWGGWR